MRLLSPEETREAESVIGDSYHILFCVDVQYKVSAHAARINLTNGRWEVGGLCKTQMDSYLYYESVYIE